MFKDLPVASRTVGAGVERTACPLGIAWSPGRTSVSRSNPSFPQGPTEDTHRERVPAPNPLSRDARAFSRVSSVQPTSFVRPPEQPLVGPGTPLVLSPSLRHGARVSFLS